MTNFYRYRVEDDRGELLEEHIQERPAQLAARRHCSAHKGRRTIRVFRVHPTAVPGRVQVFIASWSAAAGAVLGCETYTIS